MQKLRIHVAANPSTPEMKLLAAAAKKRGLDLTIASNHDPNESALEADVLYWRTDSSLKKFPALVGRNTVLQKYDGNLPVVNQSIVLAPHTVKKSIQQALYEHCYIKDINPIPTYLAATQDDFLKLLAEEKLQYPCIAKPNHGAQGKGVVLLKSAEDLAEIENWPSMIFQPFIENDGDYRIFMIGGVMHEVILRSATENSTKSYLNNISQGGKATRVEDSALRAKLQNAGVILSNLFKISICGIDVLKATDGTLYFMEINSVPQWAGPMLQDVSPYSVADHVLDTLLSEAEAYRDDFSYEQMFAYYEKCTPYLPTGKQFHLLSRLWLWFGTEAHKASLDALYDDWWPGNDMMITYASHAENVTKASIPKLMTEKRAYRQLFFEKHPKINPYNKVFFKMLFDETVYAGKGSAAVLPHINQDDVAAAVRNLLDDREAIVKLSTPAVNFIYLAKRFVADVSIDFSPQIFLDAADAHPMIGKSVEELDAHIYMYTHAIIGASSFYVERDIQIDRACYTEMLLRVEEIIATNYPMVSLDHKFEFLVCCKIMDHTSKLESAIKNEGLHSKANHGSFMVNVYNVHASKTPRKGLASTQHQNVLALMALLDEL